MYNSGSLGGIRSVNGHSVLLPYGVDFVNVVDSFFSSVSVLPVSRTFKAPTTLECVDSYKQIRLIPLSKKPIGESLKNPEDLEKIVQEVRVLQNTSWSLEAQEDSYSRLRSSLYKDYEVLLQHYAEKFTNGYARR